MQIAKKKTFIYEIKKNTALCEESFGVVCLTML